MDSRIELENGYAIEWRTGFQGATDYDVYRENRHLGRIEHRYSGAERHGYSPGVWDSDIVPTIGTVRWGCRFDGEFPPPEILAHFPAAVGCGMVLTGEPGSRRVSYTYTSPQPELVADDLGGLTTAAELARREALWSAC